jgi:post-segregation antitoxin (ccd killing protein)
MRTTILSISVPIEIAQALSNRKELASLNVSAFCSRAIARELSRPVVDAEPAVETASRRAEYQAPSPVRVLVAPTAPRVGKVGD